VPEGSRLSPTLFGIFVADLIHQLKVQFPNATITHNCGVRWIGGSLYVDDLYLISTDARELQMMINICQTWSEKTRMQLSADKTKIMCFHNLNFETTQTRNARKRPRKVENDHEKVTLFGQRHSTFYPCTQTTPTPLRVLTFNHHTYPHSYKR